MMTTPEYYQEAIALCLAFDRTFWISDYIANPEGFSSESVLSAPTIYHSQASKTWQPDVVKQFQNRLETPLSMASLRTQVT